MQYQIEILQRKSMVNMWSLMGKFVVLVFNTIGSLICDIEEAYYTVIGADCAVFLFVV